MSRLNRVMRRELKNRGIRAFAAHLEGRNTYDGENYTGGTAFLIGNEGEDVSVIYATGALDDILISDDHVLVIPAEDGEMSIMIDGKYSIIRYEAGSNLRFERR